MGEFFKEWVWPYVRELKDVKAAAFAVALFAFGVGWWSARQFYAERIEVMQLRVENAERNIARPVPQPSISGPNLTMLVGLVVVVAIAVAAIAAAQRNKRMFAQAEADATALRGLLDAAAKEHRHLTDERDKAMAMLKDKKQEYALDEFERYSNLRPMEGSPPLRVTVKYANYGNDYDLAKQIEGLFTQYVHWPVTLELTTNPALPRADKYKVVFDVGMTYFTYGRLIHAISESALLGVSVGRLQFVDREDSHHLIVMVLPSVGAEPIAAEPA